MASMFCNSCENVDLVWKYSDWLMNTNKTVGVKVGFHLKMTRFAYK